ncbi:MAG: dihydrodipicolinate synthase family protein, partial [Chlamydiia bacterium]|nr:dihydrodipicolinate synthase family protein [Chlamydiia bacterium]
MEFHGNITALVTPFVGGAFDQEGFRENIRRQLRAGVDGLLALGTTGEGSALSTDERLEVSRLLIDEAKGKTALLVQTGDLSTKQTIEKTAGAEKLGFDGVVVITPYYNRPPQEGLLSHFRSIARSTTLPILLYNNPVRTGVHLELSTLLALAEEENIVGI